MTKLMDKIMSKHKKLLLSPSQVNLDFLYFALSLSSTQSSTILRMDTSSSRDAAAAMIVTKMSFSMVLSMVGAIGVIVPKFGIN